MNKITCLILILGIVSCQKEETDGIPAYVKIDKITVVDTTINNSTTDTSTYRNITDAWVSINGINKGVHELPANFPVLDNGNFQIRIYAGIKDNGIAAKRVSYPFYYSWDSSIKLTPDSTTIINPEVYIKENISGQFDDFDNSYSFNSDSCCFQKESNGPYGNYGSLTLSDSILSTEVSYKDHPLNFGYDNNDVPQQGSPTYLELDYKNNTRFLVGVYINFPNSPTIERDLLWVSPQEDWNKIYINLTKVVTEEALGAINFSVFIKMQRNFDSEVNELQFDNIRIIHYKN
ncbi:hypothetical protein OAK24_01510 [Flavobacteriales bacterium]|nr:hypothetical protein [Flavobacteriales bacterium]